MMWSHIRLTVFVVHTNRNLPINDFSTPNGDWTSGMAIENPIRMDWFKLGHILLSPLNRRSSPSQWWPSSIVPWRPTLVVPDTLYVHPQLCYYSPRNRQFNPLSMLRCRMINCLEVIACSYFCRNYCVKYYIRPKNTRVNRSWINERGCETRVCSIHGAIVKWNDRLQGEIIAQLISIALDYGWLCM